MLLLSSDFIRIHEHLERINKFVVDIEIHLGILDDSRDFVLTVIHAVSLDSVRRLVVLIFLTVRILLVLDRIRPRNRKRNRSFDFRSEVEFLNTDSTVHVEVCLDVFLELEIVGKVVRQNRHLELEHLRHRLDISDESVKRRRQDLTSVARLHHVRLVVIVPGKTETDDRHRHGLLASLRRRNQVCKVQAAMGNDRYGNRTVRFRA